MNNNNLMRICDNCQRITIFNGHEEICNGMISTIRDFNVAIFTYEGYKNWTSGFEMYITERIRNKFQKIPSTIDSILLMGQSFITTRQIGEAICIYFNNNGFAGLTLEEYLDKSFTSMG